MIKYLNQYTSEFESELNTEIMKKTWDRELYEYIVDCWKSLEVVEYIHFKGYDWNTKMSEIDINKHIFKRDKGLKKKEKKDYKFINDDRCGLLTVHILLSKVERDPKTGEKRKREKMIHKDMLIPIPDDRGFFFINGKRYYMIYQLVEKSTYTTASSNVLKSLMPLHVIRVIKEITDVTGTKYTCPLYNTFIFRREMPIMNFIAANGLEYGLQQLLVTPVLQLVEDIPEDADKDFNGEDMYFNISPKAYIKVNREMFMKYRYLQSVVTGLLEILNKRFTLSQINDRESFTKALAPNNKLEKGKDYLVLFNRLIDVTTQKVMKLNDYHKDDVYSVLRWMMMEFNEIREKDNQSLDNKRIRCNEYIAQLLTQEFSNKLNRVVGMGSKATIEDMCDIFKFPGNRRYMLPNSSNCGDELVDVLLLN